MIRIKNLEFTYPKQPALIHNLSVGFEAGHIYGLLGRNGEGKSTLLKLIAGLLFPRFGDIATLGHEPRQRAAAMLQDVYMLGEELPDIRVSIANYERAYAPFYPRFGGEQFDRYLQEFDITSKSRPMNTLSHGQKKKVFIAFALAANTSLLLMDEPTNGLDIPSKSQFRRTVASAIDQSKCLIISTHQVRDLENLIDAITIMHRHTIVLNQPVDEIGRRLSFEVVDYEQHDPLNCLYQESTIRGNYVVAENFNGSESRVDIEMLFNAVLTDPTRVQRIFAREN